MFSPDSSLGLTTIYYLNNLKSTPAPLSRWVPGQSGFPALKIPSEVLQLTTLSTSGLLILYNVSLPLFPSSHA